MMYREKSLFSLSEIHTKLINVIYEENVELFMLNQKVRTLSVRFYKVN